MAVTGVIEQLWASTPLYVFAAVVVLCYAIGSALTSRTTVPRSLPLVGGKHRGPFSGMRAAFECLRHPRENLKEGYETYLKKGKSYVFPSFSGTPEIIVPNNKLPWLLDHPDSAASISEAHYDMLAGDYAFTHPQILRHPFHEYVIHRNISRKLGALLDPTWDEVKFQIDEAFGLDTQEWAEIGVLDKMTADVAGVSNRMLVGLPLCRNTQFRDINMRFAAGIMFVVTILQLSPKILHPIIGRLAALPNHFLFWQAKQHTLPTIKQRLADIEEEESNPTKTDNPEIPDDYITWQIRQAKESGLKEEYEPSWIARRIMPLEFASIHTTSFSIVNVIFDLLGTDAGSGHIEAIREEAERIFKEENGQWSKQALAKMIRTDSAIRESLRVSAFGLRGVQRKVLVKDGLKFDQGWTAPYGAIIATDVWTRHHDPSIYPDPYKYDAFRFSRVREAAAAEGSPEQYLKSQNLSLISTGENFLPFGHGRHACPGRFFINVELKMMLAYMVMNYDFEYLRERPANTLMGEVVLPPSKATIRVKRRSLV